MKIQLTKPLINSPFNDNGSNTFKNIEAIYLKDVNINLIKNYFHYFRSSFIKASLDFVSKNSQPSQDVEQSEGINASAIALLLFNGDQEIIDKSNEILKKVAFKDENFRNPLNDADLNELDFQDWENVICEFLANFWVSKWSLGGKKK
jgi:hypothetical protein